jgi:hypothetical protein
LPVVLGFFWVDINKPLVWFFYLKDAWAALTGFSIGLLFSLDKAYVSSSKWADIIILWDWV